MKNMTHRILPVVLALILPVMPLLRSLAPAVSQGLAPSAWSIILKLGLGSTALLGSYDAVSGASVSILPPVNGGFTITLTNGTFYKVKLAETPYVAGSWTPNGVQNTTTPVFNLFPGFYLTNATGFLAGAPVTTGGRKTNYFTIFVWGEGSEASRSVSANFTNIILPAIPGTLVVTASPPALVTFAKNRTWNLDGVWQTNGFTNLFLDPGSHIVAFTNIAGWLTPASQSISITSAVQTRILVVYTQLLSSLQVNLTPPAAVTAGATFQLDGGPWQPTSTLLTTLSPGNHTVGFSPVSGWVTPAFQTVTLTNGQTNTLNANYVLITAPVITQTSFDGTHIFISGTGSANAGFSFRSTNNLTIPVTEWPVIGTGTINAAGGFIYTQTINPAVPTAFFLFSSP